MTTTGNGRVLFVAFILVSLIAPVAKAQDGIVRAPVAQKPLSTPVQRDAHESVHQAVAEIGEVETVIPPALLVIKRNPNSISIPADEPRYEERAAYSPGVKINSDFGYRRDPFNRRRSKFHSGIDVKARLGDAIGASHRGVVSFAGWHRGYGNLIIVDHGGGVTTYYAHLSRFQLNVGDKVSRGAVVGYAGSTGRATSPHLHYEVRFEDNPVNPLQPLALDSESPFFKEEKIPEKEN